MQGKCVLCGGYITGKSTKGQSSITHGSCRQRPDLLIAARKERGY